MTSAFTAKNPENQPIIDALNELSEVETHSNVKNAGFRGRALRRAAQNLAKLQDKITSGQELANKEGPHKVKGVGKGTAYYIDEFLETGKLAEIDEFKANMKKEAAAERGSSSRDPPGKTWSTTSVSKATTDRKEAKIIHINRAPVLTLWATVVAECQGYSHDEALTYGKWISGTLAQSKGKALGIFEKKENTSEEPKAKRQKTSNVVEYVQVFQHIRIPVYRETNTGNLLALENKATNKAIEPEKVQSYLEQAFGEQDLRLVKDSMMKLANTMPQQELKDKAYEIYEMIRPEWRGWGKPGAMDLRTIHDLCDKKEGQESA